MTQQNRLSLRLHGMVVQIHGTWTSVISSLAADFRWFEVEPVAAHVHVDLTIRIDPEPIVIDPATDVAAAKISPRSVTYRLPDKSTVTDYLGLAASRSEAGGRVLSVLGPDPDLAEEIASNAVRASLVGHLDRTDKLAVHALGLAVAKGGVIVLLPAGGGKSTLAVEALRHPGVKVLSDDMPIIDRSGLVHPHPVRIGLTIGDPAAEGREGRRIERLGWRPKQAIEIESISSQVQHEPVPLRHVVLGTRNLGPKSKIRPTESSHVWRMLLQESVLRVATGGGVAWATTGRRLGPTLKKLPRVTRRATLCRSAIRDAETWELELGSDRSGCWEALAPLLRAANEGPEAP